MTVPVSYTYSAAALVAAHTAFRDLLAGGSLKIFNSADVLLSQVPLTSPAGTVNSGTGQLTVTPSGRDESADASGIAAYGALCDAAGAAHLSLPAVAGTTAVSGWLVLNSLTIVALGPVDVVSAVIG